MSQQFHSWVYNGKKPKDPNSERYVHPNVLSSIIHNCQDTEATYESINK